mgnify:CR=1 FL=1
MSRPLNLMISNTLITTSINSKGEKTTETTSYAAARMNDRPNTNDNHNNPEDYKGPTRKARPLKHYRKRLTPYNPVVTSKPTLRDIEAPGSTVNRNDSSFLVENNTNVKRHILPYSNKTLINRNCATYFSTLQ